MKNRHLLLALAGLGVFNVLVLLIILFRENSNGNRIVQLNSALHAEREQRDAQQKELIDELRKTRGDLDKTRAELTDARRLLESYKSKPWLNRSGKEEPWRVELQTLAARVKKLETMTSPPQLPPIPPPKPQATE